MYSWENLRARKGTGQELGEGTHPGARGGRRTGLGGGVKGRCSCLLASNPCSSLSAGDQFASLLPGASSQGTAFRRVPSRGGGEVTAGTSGIKDPQSLPAGRGPERELQGDVTFLLASGILSGDKSRGHSGDPWKGQDRAQDSGQQVGLAGAEGV